MNPLQAAGLSLYSLVTFFLLIAYVGAAAEIVGKDKWSKMCPEERVQTRFVHFLGVLVWPGIATGLLFIGIGKTAAALWRWVVWLERRRMNRLLDRVIQEEGLQAELQPDLGPHRTPRCPSCGREIKE